MSKSVVVVGGILVAAGIGVNMLYGASLAEAILNMLLLAAALGVFYFFTSSRFAEDARTGSLLRKHNKDAYESLNGSLVITDRRGEVR